MNNDYRKLFEMLPEVEAPLDLEAAILERVRKEGQKIARIYFAMQSILAGASLLGIMEIGSNLLKNFSQSGLFEYLSLLSSDASLFLHYWKELTLSIADSLPIMSLIAFLSITAMFIWSSLKALKEARMALRTA